MHERNRLSILRQSDMVSDSREVSQHATLKEPTKKPESGAKLIQNGSF